MADEYEHPHKDHEHDHEGDHDDEQIETKKGRKKQVEDDEIQTKTNRIKLVWRDAFPFCAYLATVGLLLLFLPGLCLLLILLV